jgi:hypothetical protein
VLSNLIAGPNPLYLPGSGGGFSSAPAGSVATAITIEFSNVPGMSVVGRLYNLAGELIAEGYNGPNGSKLMIELGGRNISSGVYVVVLTAQAPWGTVQRKSLKLVIIR